MCSIQEGAGDGPDDGHRPDPGDRPGGIAGVEFDLPAVAVRLVEAAREVAALDLATLSEDERFGLLDALEISDRLLTVSNMDARFGMTPAAFSEQRHGRDGLSWARQLRVGRRLAAWLPEVHRALHDGLISVERATVLANAVNARNAEVLAGAQAALLELSAATPRFKEFAAQVRDLAAVADADGREPEPEVSKGKVSRTGDHVAIVMDLYGTDAVAAEQMLEAEVDRLWKAEHEDAKRIPDLVPRSRAELRAAAFVELLRRGVGAAAADTKRPAVELSLLVDADRVDDLDPMLAAIVAAGSVTDRANPLAAAHGVGCPCCGEHHRLPGPDVDLPGRFTGPTVTVCRTDGTRLVLTQSQWQLLLCESDLSEVLLDALGEPLAVRGLVRFADSTMRKALTARDGGCVFPGCDAPPSWCDAHHVIEYRYQGRTVIVNLVLLCRRHHGIVHRAGWRMTRRRGGTARTGLFTITTASGCELPTQHRARSGPTHVVAGTDDAGEPPGRPAAPAA